VADAPAQAAPGAAAARGAGLRARAQARFGSVRVRTTAIALLVVAVALAVGGVALVLGLRAALTSGVERSVRQQVDAAAEVLAGGGEPGVLRRDDDDTVAQLLDADGRVVAASPAVAGAGPLAADLAPGRAGTVDVPDDGEDFLAVTARADTPDGPRTVVVASSLEPAGESAGVVAGLLVVGLPVLLLVVGTTTWRVVGRALAPVEAIRATADAVSAADLGVRVPPPVSHDEVARLAATMNRMLDRLERAQARQRRFVADASHELRSPVAAIRQHAEVAVGYPDRTTPDALGGTVLAEALRMQRLVDDLLVLARADERELGPHRRPVDLDDIVLAEARRLRTTTGLRVDAAAVSAGAVDGDPDALGRVVRNLVDNAARHAAGRVSLSLAEDGGTVTLAVEDDGPGVPPAERERVFERFVRLDDARARDGGGSGLGLAIVAELVAAHGGTVALGDAALGGARAEVRLPARP
jgi:signal transduction histidine kinase